MPSRTCLAWNNSLAVLEEALTTRYRNGFQEIAQVIFVKGQTFGLLFFLLGPARSETIGDLLSRATQKVKQARIFEETFWHIGDGRDTQKGH